MERSSTWWQWFKPKQWENTKSQLRPLSISERFWKIQWILRPPPEPICRLLTPLMLPSSWPRLFPQRTQASTPESRQDLYLEGCSKILSIHRSFSCPFYFHLDDNASGPPKVSVAQLWGIVVSSKTTEQPPGLRFTSRHAIERSILSASLCTGQCTCLSLRTTVWCRSHYPHHGLERWGWASKQLA